MKNLLLFLLLGVTLVAQPNGRPEPRPDFGRRGVEPRVIVFENANFEGAFLILYPGDSLDNLSGRNFPHGPGLNDRISSIIVEGGAELYVYTEAGFRGPSMRVTDDIRDLSYRQLPDAGRSSWNDRISSLRVEVVRRPERGRDIEPEVVIRRAFLAILVRDPLPQDMRYFRELVIRQGWTERMICEELMRWEEYRHDAIDRIIRRAYHDVLGRNPDPRDLQAHRRNFQERHWTERELCDELRRSDEFRHRPDGHR